MVTRREFIKVTAAGSALLTVGDFAEAKNKIDPFIRLSGYCLETSRNIPLLDETDVIVVGGSSGAVAAAVAARRSGSKVFLIAPLPYLGDDICGSFMYQTDKRKEQAQTALARKIFYPENDPREAYPGRTENEILYTQERSPLPLQVKTILENELIDNNIHFLYSSYITEVLKDATGNLAGVVLVSRSGRQAIRAKAIIDATPNALVAELSGAPFTSFTPGNHSFEYTVVGNSVKKADQIRSAEAMPFTFSFNGKEYPIIRYTFDYPLKDKTHASFMEAEQFIRDLTWDADQVDSSDLLWYIPSWHIVPETANSEPINALASLPQTPYVPNIIKYEEDGMNTITSVRALPKEAFACKGVGNLWVMGPCAALPRDVAAWLYRPVNNMSLGEIIGEYVSDHIAEMKTEKQVQVVHASASGNDHGEVREILSPLRPRLSDGYIHSTQGALPILGTYDVVVMGGGTAGAPAGIGAARQQVKTLVLEYLHGLGGLTTSGFIGSYWDGFREGFTAEVDKSVKEMAPADHPRQLKSEGKFRADWKMEWYRRELRKHKAEIWYGVIGCGALVKKNKVIGLIIATPWGRGVVMANTIIDSTGSADIAIAAGAGYEYTGRKNIAAQGGGLSRFNPNDYYNNTDWTLIDDSDVLDVSRLFVQSKTKYKGQYDIGKLPQTRERRRMAGEYSVSVYDIINHRHYSDTISYHRSSFDTHGMTVDPFFTLNPPGKRHVIYDADVPLRALLPKGLDGILVTGLGASAHRDAMPVIRMQPCLQNQGYSVGYLAATACKEQKPLRKINIKQIQKHLVGKGILPERVLKDKEFKGFTYKDLENAVESVTDNYKGLEVILAEKDKCIPLLKKKIKTTSGEAELVYACILCILGDKEYGQVLAEKIRAYKEWDQGWHYTASAQFGECMSPLDRLIMALGATADPAMLPCILEKAQLLQLEDHFSHFRAIATACAQIRSRQAIPVLRKLLTMEGMRYHDLPSYVMARNRVVPYIHDITYRNRILKELLIAESLYICGDADKLGEKTLQRYACGLEGHYARFADETLKNVD